MRFCNILFSVIFLSLVSNHSFARWTAGNDPISLIIYQSYFENTDPASSLTEIDFEARNPLRVKIKSNSETIKNLHNLLVESKVASCLSDYLPWLEVDITNDDQNILNILFEKINEFNKNGNENIDFVREKGISLLKPKAPSKVDVKKCTMKEFEEVDSEFALEEFDVDDFSCSWLFLDCVDIEDLEKELIRFTDDQLKKLFRERKADKGNFKQRMDALNKEYMENLNMGIRDSESMRAPYDARQQREAQNEIFGRVLRARGLAR